MTTPDVQRPVPRGSGPGSTAIGRHTASSLRTDTAMVLVSGIGGTPVHAELRYRCDDPFAVQMRLSIPGSQLVTWTVGRDLLSTGLAQPSGLGDVHIYPTGGCVVIELRTQAPTARLVADRRCPAGLPRRRGVPGSTRHRDRPLHPRPRTPPDPARARNTARTGPASHPPDRSQAGGIPIHCECGTKRVTIPAHP